LAWSAVFPLINIPKNIGKYFLNHNFSATKNKKKNKQKNCQKKSGKIKNIKNLGHC
jgi:hypothetical protein